MNKDKIIKENKTFSEIISEKNVVKNKYYSIYYKIDTKKAYGISIPKKVGKAYIRNKIKRQLKNIIITHENDIQKSANYVIIVKEAILELTFQAMADKLLDLIKKVR